MTILAREKVKLIKIIKIQYEAPKYFNQLPEAVISKYNLVQQ